MKALFRAMRPKLERSDIVFEFLDIIQRAPIFPWPLGWVQSLLIRAAVEITPAWVRKILGLGGVATGCVPSSPAWSARSGSSRDYVVLPSSPPAEACRRLGLPLSCL